MRYVYEDSGRVPELGSRFMHKEREYQFVHLTLRHQRVHCEVVDVSKPASSCSRRWQVNCTTQVPLGMVFGLLGRLGVSVNQYMSFLHHNTKIRFAFARSAEIQVVFVACFDVVLVGSSRPAGQTEESQDS